MAKPAPLQRAELEKWHKELNARETYLNERELFINSGPIDLLVLEKTIKAREQELLAIKGMVIEANHDLVSHREGIEKSKQRLDDELAIIRDGMKKHKAALQTAKTQIQEGKDSLDGLEAEIAERQDYSKRQDHDIQAASDAGNEQLLSLKFQIEEQERQKTKLALLLSDLNKEKGELEASLLPLQAKAVQLQLVYQQAATNLRQTLDDMREQIAQAGMRYKKIEADSVAKLTELKVHEEKIMAERDAIRTERAALDTEKRRWNSTKGLYQVE